MESSGSHTKNWNKVVKSFPPNVRDDIDGIWDSKGQLTAATVQRITDKLGVEVGTLMMRLLPVAQQYAVVPVSRFNVGAVAAGMPEALGCSLYLGGNFEFTDAALSFTVHGEQAATNNAWLNGQSGIQALAISAAPCGYCRQFLYELSTARELSILLPSANGTFSAYDSVPLTMYLPDAFGPGDLGVTGGLMDPKLGKHNLSLDSGRPTDPVVAAALVAASGSYAPYPTAHPSVPAAQSQAFAGVAVQLEDGSIYEGRHAVNAAYNPSFSPLQSALTFMNMNRALGASRAVNRCVLVEVPTLASQLSATQAALAAYAPGVEVEYFKAASRPSPKRKKAKAAKKSKKK